MAGTHLETAAPINSVPRCGTFRNIVRLLLVGALCVTTSACVARTAVKATTKVAKTTVKAAGAVGCAAVDVVVTDPRCKE